MGKKAKGKQRANPPKQTAGQQAWYAPVTHTHWTKRPPLLMALFGLLLLTTIAYWPTFSNDFTNWDDDLYVADNNLVRNFDVAGMFRLDMVNAIEAVFDEEKAATLDNTAFVAGNYHPLTILTLGINYKMSGLDPLSYQVTNLLLHLLNTFLVFLLVMALSGKNPLIGLITAALFALHPLHVESVSWMAERKDVLYTAFFLGGLLLYWRHLQQPSWIKLIGVLVLFILSCLAKPAAVVFPIVLLLLHFWRQIPLQAVKTHAQTIPFFVLALFFGLLTLTAQIDSNAYGGLQTYSLFERFQIAGYGWLWYIGKFIVPYAQSAFYPYPENIGINPFGIALFFAVALGVWSIWQYRFNRWITFGVLFFTINLLLVLQFVSVGSAIVAERYTYLPYIGLGWLVGYAVYQLLAGKWQHKKWGYPALYATGLVLFVFTILTFNRTKVWANSETLFTDVIEKQPRAVVAWNNRGHYYRQLSDDVLPQQRDLYLDKAFADYNQALIIDPKYHLGYSNRGKVWYEKKNFREAIRDYTRSLNLKADNSTTWVNRGAAYASIGKVDSALLDFSKAFEIDPNNDQIYFNRGLAYQQRGQFDNAIADFETYLTFRPNAHGIINGIGVANQSKNDHAAAIDAFSKAISIAYEQNAPDLATYIFNRSISYRVLGQIDAARNDVRQAEQLGYPVPANYKQALGL